MPLKSDKGVAYPRAFLSASRPSQQPPNAFKDARALRVERHDLGDDVLRVAQGVFLGLVWVIRREIESDLIDAFHINRP
jgi:hypothetical protein